MKGIFNIGLGYIIGNEKARNMAIKMLNEMGNITEKTVKNFMNNGKEEIENGKDEQNVPRSIEHDNLQG